MTKSPFINAALASAYIAAVSTFLYYGPHAVGPVAGPIVPMVMLSLFVLSAAVMSYLFLYQPFVLYFDDKKQGAVNLFLSTTGIFAVITAGLLGTLFFVA